VELKHEFTVGIPVDEAWEVLTDVERIAPCLPGAQLQEVVGDEYRGAVKVKVGPVSAEYRGIATFVEQDPATYRALLRAQGREARGQGSARADITATLLPSGGATTVQVVTDLTVSGRVAQFGRGVLADVSARLLDEFAACLESTVAAGAAAPGPGEPAHALWSPPAPEPGVEPHGGDADANETDSAGRRRPRTGTPPPPLAAAPSAPSVDLVRVAGPALAKRLLPVLLGAVVVWAVWRRLQRRPRARAGPTT